MAGAQGSYDGENRSCYFALESIIVIQKNPIKKRNPIRVAKLFWLSINCSSVQFNIYDKLLPASHTIIIWLNFQDDWIAFKYSSRAYDAFIWKKLKSVLLGFENSIDPSRHAGHERYDLLLEVSLAFLPSDRLLTGRSSKAEVFFRILAAEHALCSFGMVARLAAPC